MKRMIPLLLAALFAAGPARAVELDLDFVAAGTAPLSEVLRKAYPGADLALQFAWSATAYFDLGARYGLGIFPQQAVDAQGGEREPVLDHSLSVVLGLAIVSGEQLGWLEPGGTLGGDLRLDLGVGWHGIGREHCAGLDVGLAWVLRVARDWNVGTLFRLASVFGTSQGTAAYVIFGFEFGFDFGGLLETSEPAPAPAPAPVPAPAPAPAPVPAATATTAPTPTALRAPTAAAGEGDGPATIRGRGGVRR